MAAFAKSDPALAFDNLLCLSAVDYPKEDPPRMEVVYHLFSYEHGHKFVLKVHLPRDRRSSSSILPRRGRRSRPTPSKSWMTA